MLFRGRQGLGQLAVAGDRQGIGADIGVDSEPVEGVGNGRGMVMTGEDAREFFATLAEGQPCECRKAPGEVAVGGIVAELHGNE